MTPDLLRIAIVTSVVFAVAAVHPRAASGQDQPPRIGPFVVDIRGTAPTFPSDELVAQSRGLSIEELPARGLGLDGGAHLYLFKWRVITFGAGAQMTIARAASPAVVQDGVETLRGVTSWFTSFTPQISFNFGTRDGWSYLSAGAGRMDVVTKTAGAYVKAKPGASITPEVVAKHIEKAITARRPKTRDVIGAQAHQILTARAVLPDRLWDRFLATQFPPPQPD